MRVTVERLIVHRCPYRDELDVGTVRASWDGDSVELHAFAAQVDKYRDLQVTHEQVTHELGLYLKAECVENVEVVTTWQTAGMAVTVTA